MMFRKPIRIGFIIDSMLTGFAVFVRSGFLFIFVPVVVHVALYSEWELCSNSGSQCCCVFFIAYVLLIKIIDLLLRRRFFLCFSFSFASSASSSCNCAIFFSSFIFFFLFSRQDFNKKLHWLVVCYVYDAFNYKHIKENICSKIFIRFFSNSAHSSSRGAFFLFFSMRFSLFAFAFAIDFEFYSVSFFVPLASLMLSQ